MRSNKTQIAPFFRKKKITLILVERLEILVALVPKDQKMDFFNNKLYFMVPWYFKVFFLQLILNENLKNFFG